MHFYIGQSFEQLGDQKQALVNYKKCLALDQNFFSACLALANLLVSLGAGERALKYFEHALRIDRQSVAAHFGTAKIYADYPIVPDNEDRAIDEFQVVVRLSP